MAGGVKPRRRGTRAENELASLLWDLGYAVMRGPASGSGVRRRFQPDLIAIKNGKIIVFEVKYANKEKPLYIESSRALALTDFSSRAGAFLTLIAVKVKGLGWRFHAIDSLVPTRGGNFKIERPERGLKLRDLDNIVRGTRKITEFME
ncbi:MAG: Holliday junction resolvase [Desulfurococcales archaeon]|nr:Holliday junction resolvase [Desulfurococcales archaeon]